MKSFITFFLQIKLKVCSSMGLSWLKPFISNFSSIVGKQTKPNPTFAIYTERGSDRCFVT